MTPGAQNCRSDHWLIWSTPAPSRAFARLIRKCPAPVSPLFEDLSYPVEWESYTRTGIDPITVERKQMLFTLRPFQEVGEQRIGFEPGRVHGTGLAQQTHRFVLLRRRPAPLIDDQAAFPYRALNQCAREDQLGGAWNRDFKRGYVAIEVFNSTCDHIGRADTECDWSHLLDAGRILPTLAVDDSHGDTDATGRAWTWLKLSSLSPEAVLQALRTGCGYSSTGPVINDFRIEKGHITLSCSPAETVYFVVHNTVAGAVHRAEGTPIRSVTRALPGNWSCFRAVVVGASVLVLAATALV